LKWVILIVKQEEEESMGNRERGTLTDQVGSVALARMESRNGVSQSKWSMAD